MTSFVKKHPIFTFFTLTFFINWAGFALNVAGYFPAFGEWVLSLNGEEIARIRGRRTMLVWAPNIAAIIVLIFSGQWGEIFDIFKRFFKCWIHVNWYLAAIFVPLIMMGSAITIHAVLGGETDFSGVRALPMIFLIRNIFALTTGGIGEEAGLRGFALERWQKTIGPLKASIYIGFLWGLLHLPMWTVRGWSSSEVIFFVVMILSLSIFLTWIYNSTGGSLLLVALMHNIVNAGIATLTQSHAAVVSYSAFSPMFASVFIAGAVILVYRTRGKLGYQ